MGKTAGFLGSTTFVLSILVSTQAGAAEALRPDQVEFRGLYKELVETNTTLSSGSCTLAAQKMAARLRAAGLSDSQITLFAAPDHPKEGGLVAVYPGTSKNLKPILGIAHLDVVDNGPGFAADVLDDAANSLNGLRSTVRRQGGELSYIPVQAGSHLRMSLPI